MYGLWPSFLISFSFSRTQLHDLTLLQCLHCVMNFKLCTLCWIADGFSEMGIGHKVHQMFGYLWGPLGSSTETPLMPESGDDSQFEHEDDQIGPVDDRFWWECRLSMFTKLSTKESAGFHNIINWKLSCTRVPSYAPGCVWVTVSQDELQANKHSFFLVVLMWLAIL